MARINWTEQALDDVEAICDFISKDAPRYAQIFAGKVFNATEILATYPYSGRSVPEVDDDKIREIILGNYRIIYKVKNGTVDILTVYHSARLLDTENLI